MIGAQECCIFLLLFFCGSKSKDNEFDSWCYAFNVLTHAHIEVKVKVKNKVNILCPDTRLEGKTEYMAVCEAVARIRLHIREYH